MCDCSARVVRAVPPLMRDHRWLSLAFTATTLSARFRGCCAAIACCGLVVVLCRGDLGVRCGGVFRKRLPELRLVISVLQPAMLLIPRGLLLIGHTLWGRRLHGPGRLRSPP